MTVHPGPENRVWRGRSRKFHRATFFKPTSFLSLVGFFFLKIKQKNQIAPLPVWRVSTFFGLVLAEVLK